MITRWPEEANDIYYLAIMADEIDGPITPIASFRPLSALPHFPSLNRADWAHRQRRRFHRERRSIMVASALPARSGSVKEKRIA